ncbi:MAG: membrane dipeptidase, partial [Bdellovibrionales bacterium]|nr:membrane dipeptidase [Oligoflexia bacterium]
MYGFAKFFSVSLLTLFPVLSALATEPAVPGFADLHNHMMAEFGYGGAWFHGHASGPEEVAMKSCDGNMTLTPDHARTKISLINELLGQTAGSSGDTGFHAGKKGGYPNYEGWPRWDTIAHQQMWEGHLKKAHSEGLTLMIMSAVNFKPMCLLMPERNKEYSCEDMEAVALQISEFKKFVNTRDWLEIASSPGQAREIISRGKLAVLLSVEVTDLFPSGDWHSQLKELYLKGVRSIQVVHQYNSRFAGAATHNKIFRVLASVGPALGVPGAHFDLNEEEHNLLGLTDEGKVLVDEMMGMGMLIDLAHLSEKGISDVAEISRRHDGYPLMVSHGHFRDIMSGLFNHYEKSSPGWVIELVRSTGGIFGLRTGAEATKAFGTVPNDCAGSSKSFAQAYEYGSLKYKLPIAFGTDLNGFIQQMRPRFGNNQETCGAEKNKTLRLQQIKLQSSKSGESFDQSGFGHIGQIGSIVREL